MIVRLSIPTNLRQTHVCYRLVLEQQEPISHLCPLWRVLSAFAANGFDSQFLFLSLTGTDWRVSENTGN